MLRVQKKDEAQRFAATQVSGLFGILSGVCGWRHQRQAGGPWTTLSLLWGFLATCDSSFPLAPFLSIFFFLAVVYSQLYKGWFRLPRPSLRGVGHPTQVPTRILDKGSLP